MSKKQNRNEHGQFTPLDSPATQARESATMIYEVRGMTEFIAMIPAGNAMVPLHFTGGTISGYGSRPASAEISDPVFRQYIELSPLFRSGKITCRPKSGQSPC